MSGINKEINNDTKIFIFEKFCSRFVMRSFPAMSMFTIVDKDISRVEIAEQEYRYGCTEHTFH